MIKFKKFLVLFITLLTAISFSTFAGGQDEMASASTEDAKQTITVAAGAVGMEFTLAEEAAKTYMESHPGVEINVLQTPDLTTDRLGLYLQFFQSKSSEVDLYQIDVIWPGDIAEHLVDLNQYGAKEFTDAHFEAIIQNNTVDGKLVAMPWFTDAGLLYFRTDLLAKYGYNAPPQTWDELKIMATKVMNGERAAGNQDFWGFVFQGNSYEGLTCDAIEWVASNDGGSIVEPDGTISINNANAAQALDRAASWVGTIAPDGVTAFGEEDARNMFQAGNALFMRNWPYAYSLGNGDGSVIKGKFDVSPLPSGKNGMRGASLGGWQLAVSKYSKNPELAADVLFYFTGYEQQKKRAIVGSYNPTIESLYDDAEVLAAVPFFGSLKAVFLTTVARPSTVTAPRYAQVSKVFFDNVHKVLMGESTGAKAVRNIELDISDIIE